MTQVLNTARAAPYSGQWINIVTLKFGLKELDVFSERICQTFLHTGLMLDTLLWQKFIPATAEAIPQTTPPIQGSRAGNI